MVRVALDVGHIHKWDRIDHGAEALGRVEVWEALKYARVAKSMLEERDHEVYMTDWTLGVLVGSYPDRHAWANEHGIDVYFACHVNASDPPGDYALVEIVEGAYEKTVAAARKMTALFEEALGVPAHLRRLARGDRGYVCIGGLRASALLVEPYFINNPAHRFAPEQVAEVIVRTVEFFDGL